jgi:hypothetical protein
MFDFVKMQTSDLSLCKRLLSNSLLTFSSQVNESTGEVINDKQAATYGNMAFHVYQNGRVFISGSLHKLYNFILGRSINHDVFTYQKLSYIIGFLKDHFELNPESLSIHNLEFGVNIEPEEPVNKILTSFIVYKQHPFNKMVIRGTGSGIDCYLNEYAIKVYNKGAQYGCPENILRFEKKVFKMRSEFDKHLVLSDLLDKMIWSHCGNSLQKAIDDIIITENMDLTTISKPDLNVIKECENPRAWMEFTRRQRSQKKERFNHIMKTYGQLNTRSGLKTLIHGAVNKMLSIITYHPYNEGTAMACSVPA